MRPAGAAEIRDLNARYHDATAHEYDAKWSIAFDGASQAVVTGKLRKALGRQPGRFDRGLEVGAGTGYFVLNLIRAGVVEQGVATDISEGMLHALARTAERLSLPVATERADAVELPFPDDHFDLVVGHAVLHHLPDLDAAFREFRRVLRPGGTLAFCGEPSRHGDRLASLPKRLAAVAAPAWRFAMRASERRNGSGEPVRGAGRAARGGHSHAAAAHEPHELEWLVDVHSFTPRDLARLARRAGLEQVRVRGEELTANWFGWISRTLEGSAEPDQVPAAWRWYAYGGYLALSALDRRLLEPYLPAALFYNLLLSARAPAS
jgi:ubiquinone/menaquinone biosynthesis C-methylase UbiE